MKLSSKEKKQEWFHMCQEHERHSHGRTFIYTGLNPANYKMIGDEASLLTSGFYGTLTSGDGRAFTKGGLMNLQWSFIPFPAWSAAWVLLQPQSGACLTLGNLKCHRFVIFFAMIGSGVAALSMTGVYIAYTQVAATSKPKKVEPVFPAGIYAVVIIALIVFAVALISKSCRKFQKRWRWKWSRRTSCSWCSLPFLLLAFCSFLTCRFGMEICLLLIIKQVTRFQWVIFVGFKWFTYLFQNTATAKDIVMVLRNTLIMSGLESQPHGFRSPSLSSLMKLKT